MRSEASKTTLIDVGEKGLPPRQPVSIEYLCARLGISDRTLVHYRKIAFSIPAYRLSALTRNPQYLQAKLRELQQIKAGKRAKSVMPDPPPFLPLEVHILDATASLFSEFKSTALVKSYIEHNPEFWRKFNNDCHNQRTQTSHGQPVSGFPEDRQQSSDIVAISIRGESR